MNKLTSRGIAAATFAALAALGASHVQAQDAGRGVVPPAHDSNTLHKIGKAVQYLFQKAGENTSKTSRKAAKATQYSTRKVSENTSVAAHEAVGKKSVIRRRAKKANRVVTPNGKVYTMPQARAKGIAAPPK